MDDGKVGFAGLTLVKFTTEKRLDEIVEAHEAAGAMIFIVVEEVIPESQRGGNTDLATMGLIAGFIVMMSLDVALG